MYIERIIIAATSGAFIACIKEIYSIKKELWKEKHLLNNKIDELEMQISNMKKNIDFNNEFLTSLEGKINSFSPTKKRKNKIEIEYEEINDPEIPVSPK